VLLLFIEHKNYTAGQTFCTFLMVNKLIGPWVQMVFPNKWKQYGLADWLFG